MALLKEDGSLNIEWLNKLPIEEFTKVFGGLTQKQVDEYCYKLPINESKGPTEAVYVDYPMETDGVDAVDFMKEQRKKYGTMR